MQSYPLKLTPTNIGTTIQSQARRFVYESGASTPVDKDLRLIVKPDSGGEIVLRPGQAFALPEGQSAQQWNVRLFDTSVTLDAAIIIGSGEFQDANTLNRFTLDGEFANNVTVDNGEANPAVVKIAGDGIMQVSGITMAIKKSWTTGASTLGAASVTICPAADNVAGIIINKIHLPRSSTSGAVNSLSARHPGTGDNIVFFIASDTANATSFENFVEDTTQYRFPAGYEINITYGVTNYAGHRLVCYTTL